MRLAGLAIWILLLMLLTLGFVESKVTEVSSSIVVVGPEDYSLYGNTSRCMGMVDRAARETNSRLNFVPTLFWADRQYKPSKQPTNSISYFCFEPSLNTDSTTSCKPATQQDIDTFQHSMQACFARAVEYNMSIEVTPRLQHSADPTIPSNTLDFRPLIDQEDFSYMDVMLTPLAAAINGAIDIKTRVWFALGRHIGASLFKHPLEYIQAAGTTHYNLYDNLPSNWPQILHVGLSLPFNKLCGCALTEVADPTEYIAQFPASFKQVQHSYDLALMPELLHHIDFISVSGLAPLSPHFAPGDLQTTLELFAQELSVFGIDLSAMLASTSLALHWVDLGLGGSTALGKAAETAAEAASSSSFGVLGKNSQITDPWDLRAISNSDTPVRTFLSYFYNNTAEYFWKQHDYKYQVDAAFIKSFGSWDFQAIHPDSTSQDGSYYFERASQVIRYHNQRSQRLLHLSEALGEAGIKFLIESRRLQHQQSVARMAAKRSGSLHHNRLDHAS